MASSNIEWTDAVWNPVTGCDKVSPGCAHCYAETVALRFWETQYPPVEYTYHDPTISSQVTDLRPRDFTDVQCHEDRLDQPLRWRKPRQVFVNSMSDLFHEDVADAFIDQIFAVMALCQQHTFQVLTKRAERMRDYCLALLPSGNRGRSLPILGAHDRHAPVRFPLSNVWLGVSVESQRFADERIPVLLKTPAAVRFVSYEPALGPVDFSAYLPVETIGGVELETWLDWVIVGGESGPQARPFDVSWARSVVAQCKASGVPAFVKQLGTAPYDSLLAWKALNRREADLATMQRVGAFRKNGKWDDMSEWPADLRVRQQARFGTQGVTQEGQYE